MPPAGRHWTQTQSLLLFGLLFALLIGNAAAGLASGLARGLAFAAAAVLGAFAKIAGGQGLNVLHNQFPPIQVQVSVYSITAGRFRQSGKNKFLPPVNSQSKSHSGN